MKKLILLFSLFLLAPPFLATADTRTVQETENQNQYAEKEALISSKDSEISRLRNNLAELNNTISNQKQQIASLNGEKNALTTQMQETTASKNRTITILAVLLGIAVIVAIAGFVMARKR